MSIAWTTVENAIQAWLASSTGITPSSVIWRNQKLPRPPRPYATMLLMGPRRIGLADEIRAQYPTIVASGWAASTAFTSCSGIVVSGNLWQVTTGGTTGGTQPSALSSGSPPAAVTDGSVVWTYLAPGSEVTLTTYGAREITVSCQVYSDVLTGEGTARDLLSQAQSSLSLQSTLDALDAAGLSFLRGGDLRDLTALVDTAYESRAQMDVVLGVTDSASSGTGYIDSLQLTNGLSS